MKLTQDQITILSNWRLEDNRFYLQWQLDRKQYLNINEVLNTIGLIWNKWKKAHIADITWEELQEAINDIIETWEVETLKETIKKFQFYPTPKEVAEYLVELAEIPSNCNILEPSAWKWDIVKALHWSAGIQKKTLIELDVKNYEYLISQDWNYENIDVKNIDFLDMDYSLYSFDRVIMNPPFSKSQDVKHILHAYKMLAEWWILVSVASSSIKTREGKLYDELRDLNPEFIELPEWSFKESWTMVNTIIIKLTK